MAGLSMFAYTSIGRTLVFITEWRLHAQNQLKNELYFPPSLTNKQMFPKLEKLWKLRK